MSKETKKWWEMASKDYQEESNIKTGIHYGPGAPFENRLNLLGNLKGKKVLEVGCGGAQCGIAMAKKGAIVTGIDISKEQLKLAKKLAERNKVKIKFIQRDFKKFPEVKSNSQDIAFSAFALQYADDLLKTLKEIHRVLKKGGIFVWSLDHPFFRVIIDPKQSYFETGRWTEKHGKDLFVMYNHKVSDLYNGLVQAGFKVEKMIEPDSRKKYKDDPWYGLWDMYLPKYMEKVPPTIIFKSRKEK
jgi:ubiquinone/menaquinone biosynthesis C-methylase UbiE